MSRLISYTLYVDWNNNGSFAAEDNVSNYLLGASGDESISNPDESTFASNGFVTEATFTLFNQGQRFSPTNSSGPLYTYIQNGKFYQLPVKFEVTIAGTTHTVFSGAIKSITESPRKANENGTVSIRCTTDDGVLINKKIETPNETTRTFYETGKDEGRLIAKTLELCDLEDGVDFISQDYPGTPTVDIPTIAPGMFTIPWYWLDSESPIEDCWKLAAACGGRFFFDVRTKMYTYQNMTMYGTVTEYATSQTTISESNSDVIMPVLNDKELYEKIKVTAQPRGIGYTQTVWESEDIPRLAPGEVLVLWAKLNNPIYKYSTPAYTWEATTTSGYSRTSDVSISASYYTQSVKFTITNSGVYHIFLRNFKLMGKPIEGGENYVYDKLSDNTTFWSSKDGKERAIENPYIQTPAQAQAIGDLLAGRQGNFGERYSVKGYKGNNFLRAGQRVTLSNSTIGINTDAIITKASFSLGTGEITQDLELFSTTYIHPLPNTNYFKIGTNSHTSAKKYFY